MKAKGVVNADNPFIHNIEYGYSVKTPYSPLYI